MSTSIKHLFQGYLAQLRIIAEKTPEDLYTESLHGTMFPLGSNTQIAANFLIRGYYPLLGKAVPLCELSGNGKSAHLDFIAEVHNQLQNAPDFAVFDDNIMLQDKAGFAEVNLCQSDFIFRYIVPNFMFHMSMVYAIARKSGVHLSKGDFDGLHSYPPGFSFVQ